MYHEKLEKLHLWPRHLVMYYMEAVYNMTNSKTWLLSKGKKKEKDSLRSSLYMWERFHTNNKHLNKYRKGSAGRRNEPSSGNAFWAKQASLNGWSKVVGCAQLRLLEWCCRQVGGDSGICQETFFFLLNSPCSQERQYGTQNPRVHASHFDPSFRSTQKEILTRL